MGTKLSGRRLDQGLRNKARQLLWEGGGLVEVASVIGCCREMIDHLVAQWGRRRPRVHNPLRLSLGEREEISRGLLAGESLRSIARRLGRHASTVSREVKANGGVTQYRAWCGDERAENCGYRPKLRKLRMGSELSRAVERGLSENWSPQQIANGFAWSILTIRPCTSHTKLFTRRSTSKVEERFERS